VLVPLAGIGFPMMSRQRTDWARVKGRTSTQSSEGVVGGVARGGGVADVSYGEELQY
jgi:hypothetical protein